MRTRHLFLLPAAVLALAPLASDGAPTPCCNNTTSLASSLTHPVVGDEAFFKLPTGPASVMLLLDTSGSMYDFPQCGDYGWDAGGAPITCRSPTVAVPAAPSGTNTTGQFVNVEGTCTPYTDGSGRSLRWMEDVTPKATLADPGRVNALLHDCPPWGDGGPECASRCEGNRCMFEPKAYYRYASWQSGSTAASNYAVRSAHDDLDDGLPGKCVLLTAAGAPVLDCAGNPIDLGPECHSCMDDHGFFFYRARYASSCSHVGANYTVTATTNLPATTSRPSLLMRGTFLNANPPKFVSARTVVKSLAWMDPADTGEQLQLDQVRLGLTILDTSGLTNQRARLIVPLGPDKGHAYPPTFEGFRQARQYILSVLNYDQSTYNRADSTQIIDGSTITGGFFDPTSSSTPLASALFNIGQYFTSVGVYTSRFGAAYERNEFRETSAGRVNAPWATAAGNTQCSYCWACQNSSVIVITDGSPNSEITLPATVNGYDTTTYNLAANCGRATCALCYEATDPDTDTSSCNTCPCAPCTAEAATCSTQSPCNCISPSQGSATRLPRVASYLHNNDLRNDFSAGAKQLLTVHSIGFNTMSQLDPRVYNILRATANMGGGTAAVAGNEADLADAVFNAVRSVLPKQNSFSVASANSLQTTQYTTAEAFITRFKPNETFPWEGHVFEAFVFNERDNGCVDGAATQPSVSCQGVSVSADYDDDGTCSGTFLVDQDCDRIAEDAVSGDFVKAGTTTAANLPWDAGKVLSDSTQAGYRSADELRDDRRTIFTWLGGSRVEFTAANAATLQPHLNLDSAWCSTLLTKLGIVSATPLVDCAKQVIYFVRGWDVLNQDGDTCAGPGKANPLTCQRAVRGEERDRDRDGRTAPLFWKLGDIAHSSPAVVTAPVHEFLCSTGLDKQCKATIYSPAHVPQQTPMPSSGGTTVDTYVQYRGDYQNRRRVLYVGGNDGMLHAFDAGTFTGISPLTLEDRYTPGSGEELWAFIPPDILPRLRELLEDHRYLVDASVMASDVWVDGSDPQDGVTTDLSLTGKDGVKDRDEYHTVVVFGRRTGGNQYSSLDVTDPTKPTFLWNFPEGCSTDADYMGQSWVDFAPKPPSIGAVKVIDPTPTVNDGNRGFAERWIVAINGGYDPSLNLGRAVFMVDVWSGKSIWRFTDDDWSDTYGQPGHMFPVPAGVALLDVGKASSIDIDGDLFFDTATWGDMGGNVWVARLHEPGKLDAATGQVTNWYASRAFEQRRQSDDSQHIAGRNEFFYISANVYDGATRTVRTYLGSGNRERLMTTTANCETDDLLGCCKAGCTTVQSTMERTYSSGYGRTDTFSCSSGTLSYSHSTSGSTLACSVAGDTYSATETVRWVCPGAGAIADSTGTVTCSGSGTCAVTPIGEKTISSASFLPPSPTRFYGFWLYGAGSKRATTKVFDTLAQAKTFDEHRFTDDTFGGHCVSPAGTCELVDVSRAIKGDTFPPACFGGAGYQPCWATRDDAGWFYEHGTVCPLESCAAPPPWTDEKTGANANVVEGCTYWNSFRPVGTATSTDPCSGTLGTPVSYGYGVDYITGYASSTCSGGAASVAVETNVSAAPNASQTVVSMNTAQQKLRYSKQEINSSQASTTTAAERSMGGSGAVWVEVPRQAHACRHQTATSSTTVCK